MPDERLEVSVTFDERHGYIGSAPELRQAVVALSLGGLRRKIEIAMLPDDVRVVLQLDGLAERERHRRRAQAQLSRIAQLTNGLPSRTNVCTRRKRTCGPQGGSPGLTQLPTWRPASSCSRLTQLRPIEASKLTPRGACSAVSTLQNQPPCRRSQARRVDARHRVLPVVSSCTGIIRCSLGLPGNMT